MILYDYECLSLLPYVDIIPIPKISKSAPSPVIRSWSSSSFRSRRSQNSSAAPFCRTAAKATWRSARRRGEAKRRARPSVLTAAMTRARSSWRLSFKGEGRTGGWGRGEHGGKLQRCVKMW